MAVPVEVLVTVPPYADFVDEVAAHPLCDGLRLNTVMPVERGMHREVLERLADHGVPVWVDLKARQLRVVEAAIPPFTEVRVSHPVEVETPVDAFFDDGRETVRVVAVDGDRLILEDGPRRVVGPGESVNIVCPTLRVDGHLTETDRTWLEAAREAGNHRYMLSYVEDPADLEAVRDLDPDAEVICKIENGAGLDFAREHGAAHGRLMAARGDLFVEVLRPHRVLEALRTVIRADPGAIAASRLFPSLADAAVPAAGDITDAGFLLATGYRAFMLGDEVCLRRGSVLAALNLLEEIARETPGEGTVAS